MAGTDILHASTVSPQVITSQQLTATDASIYTVPASTSIKIQKGLLCNVTNGTVYVNLSLLKTGQSIDATHRFIHNYPLAGGDTLSLDAFLQNVVMGPGDFIAGFASIASSVNVIISGMVHQ
jgi:hypothetical protein